MAPKPRRPEGQPLLEVGDSLPVRAKKVKPPTGVSECMQAFREGHMSKLGLEPHIHYGKDGKHFKELVALWGLDVVLRLIALFFSTTDPRVVRSDYKVGAFYSLAQHLILLDRRHGPKDRRTAENLDAATRATQRRS